MIIVMLGILVGQVCLGQANLDSQKMSEVYRLVLQTNEPYFIADPVERKRWQEQELKREEQRIATIKSMPDLKPYLFNLLEEHYYKHPNEDVESILEALSLRDDLTEDDVSRIAAEAKRILASPYRQNDYKHGFLEASVAVIARFPSEENENLLIEVLKRGEEEYALYIAAAEGLASIGSSKVIPVLDQVISRMTRAKGVEPLRILMESHRDSLVYRLSKSRQGQPSHPPTQASAGGEAARNATEENKNKTSGFFWVVAIATSLVVLLTLVLRSRKEKE